MHIADVRLLFRKIAVGAMLTLVPLLILAGGLWITQQLLDSLAARWYHRVHHEIPWLWRFHRTHHSAPYMGMSTAGRQNVIYSVFFSQTYLTSILVYLGLGPAAAVVLGMKSMITALAHSSIPWDKPLYRYKALQPIAWVVERFELDELPIQA